MVSPPLEDPPKCPCCNRVVDTIVRETDKHIYYYCHHGDCFEEVVKQEKKNA